MRVDPATAWFSDVVDRYFVKSGSAKRQQGDAIAQDYEPFATAAGLQSAGLPLDHRSMHWCSCRTAGLACRFDDLRHTSVALAIAEGAPPKAIQDRMGHSSINVTLDLRALLPELDEASPLASAKESRQYGALDESGSLLQGPSVASHCAVGRGAC